MCCTNNLSPPPDTAVLTGSDATALKAESTEASGALRELTPPEKIRKHSLALTQCLNGDEPMLISSALAAFPRSTSRCRVRRFDIDQIASREPT